MFRSNSNINLGVVSGHVDAAVAQDQADLIEGDAMAQHRGSRRVAQQVGAFAAALMPARRRACLTTDETPSPEAKGVLERCCEGTRDRTGRPWAGSQDNEATRRRPLGQRQSHLISPFARYLHSAIVSSRCRRDEAGPRHPHADPVATTATGSRGRADVRELCVTRGNDADQFLFG